MRPRVIPILLLEDGGLVKSIRFKEKEYIGDPLNTVKLYNEMEVDELVILDISASKKNVPPDFDFVDEIVSNAFMPICYGGGIKTEEHAKKLFSLGVEKIALNSAIFSDFELITKLSKNHGKQSIVASIDIEKSFTGAYQVFNHVTKKHMHIDLNSYLLKIEQAGAGEVLFCSVYNDGKMLGYDLKLIDTVYKNLSIPLIICGGAGSLHDIKMAIEHGADAAAAGSLFVYKGKTKGILINYPSQKELNALFAK
jgi:cyclase